MKKDPYKYMKEHAKQIIRFCIPTTLSLTVLTAILRTLFLFTAYDAKTGYLDRGLPTGLIAALYCIGLIACLLPSFLLPKNLLEIQDKICPSLRMITGLLCAVTFFVCGVSFLGSGAIFSNKQDLFCGILSVVSTLFFLFSALSFHPAFKGRFAGWIPWLGFAVIGALLLMLSTAYFDMTVAINGPFTAVYLFSLLSCAMFILLEIRRMIGRPLPRAHLASALIAFFLSASSSVGNLLFCFLGDTGAGKTTADPVRPLVLLALSMYVLGRLITLRIPTIAEEN